MVKISYQARQQFQGLSPLQKKRLNRILARGVIARKAKSNKAGKLIERLDDETRVMWEPDAEGNALVLSIVSQQTSQETPSF